MDVPNRAAAEARGDQAFPWGSIRLRVLPTEANATGALSRFWFFLNGGWPWTLDTAWRAMGVLLLSLGMAGPDVDDNHVDGDGVAQNDQDVAIDARADERI